MAEDEPVTGGHQDRRTVVMVPGAPVPRGSLSHGMAANGILFISGSVAFHSETGEIVGDNVRDQTRQTLSNALRILRQQQLDFTDVLSCRVHLTDVRRDFRDFDDVYREIVPEPRPARTTVGSTLAVEGLLVEIDMVAALRT